MKTIYIVGKKASFVHGGRVYGPNTEIDASIFSEDNLKVLTKSEKLLTKDQAKVVFADEAEAAPPPQTTQPDVKKEKTLDEMSVEELKKYAAEKNITVSGNKAEILAAIKAAIAKPSGDGQKSFDEMSFDELKAYAKEKNISTKSGVLLWQKDMSRDELLAEIKAVEAEKANAGGAQ